MQLVRELFEGPLDVIGDVHGELDALKSLLSRLGYDDEGVHRDGRRLIFVGDLVDRGPDSPGVVRLVKKLVENKLAQCVLGNHEMNLLRADRKHGNAWFTDPAHREMQVGGEFEHCEPATEEFRQECLTFLASLPVALEREDLRVVHAVWDHKQLAALMAESGPAVQRFNLFDERSQERLEKAGITARAEQEKTQWAIQLKDRNAHVPLLTNLGASDADFQMGNPLRVLTSGEERVAQMPFWASGQWRMCDRVPWWNHYTEDVPVVVGHFWRTLAERSEFARGEKYDLFTGIGPLDWLGQKKNVFCIDYSAGARYTERVQGSPDSAITFRNQLCAMRWPERQVWSGETGQLGTP